MDRECQSLLDTSIPHKGSARTSLPGSAARTNDLITERHERVKFFSRRAAPNKQWIIRPPRCSIFPLAPCWYNEEQCSVISFLHSAQQSMAKERNPTSTCDDGRASRVDSHLERVHLSSSFLQDRGVIWSMNTLYRSLEGQVCNCADSFPNGKLKKDFHIKMRRIDAMIDVFTSKEWHVHFHISHDHRLSSMHLFATLKKVKMT